MSDPSKKPIGNAAQIIEKFGGIRPMSTKITVAVTTIQGWKKRGSIPTARKTMILKAALEHNIDLSEFFDDAPVIKKAIETEEVIVKDTPEAKPATPAEPIKKDDEFAPTIKRNNILDSKNFTEISMEVERKAIIKIAAISVSTVTLVIIIALIFMWPSIKKFGEQGKKLATLEGDISNIKDMQSSFKGFVPENWSKQLSDLKKQVSQAKGALDDTVNSVKNMSKDITNTNGLEERVVKLQSYVSSISQENGIYSLLSRFNGMSENAGGQSTLDNAVLQISSILAMSEDKDDSYINNALNAAREQNTSMQQTLGDVPKNELKAAAMLLALTQVRSSLNRSDEAFDSDLNLLMNLVGDDNPELKDSLEKLAPHAKAGVLSPKGLQTEFRTIAGDVVAASLSGEDVSFSEKASARMNDILQVEKDGELLTGTQTQAKVKKADKMMQNGNLNGAITYLKKNLNSKEIKPLKPWIKKAEAVMNSAKVKSIIDQAIELNVGSGYLGGSQLLNDQ